MNITKCPKCGYDRQPADRHINTLICPACGIAYHKWIERTRPENTPPKTNVTFTRPESWLARIVRVATDVPETVDLAAFMGRAATLLALSIWGGHFIAAGIDWEVIGGSFMHHINLPFHEFGHVLFSPFGRFMHILGGSLFQVLLPLGLMFAFIVQRQDTFAASVMLWWAGQSLIDLAPYIADARYRSLPLVGGMGEEFHDWGNLLTMMNALNSTQSVARFDFGLGAVLIVLASAWGAYVLYRQKQNLR